ncbi:hypothetical protein [Streptomyces avicenniae]|uniref:hypothetical protein n=1 Tax=Streptomyces avicenniae TaxID=500153 RepID=UPI00069AE725|nr:hypothetical protein [Streptomyces avicenniae]
MSSRPLTAALAVLMAVCTLTACGGRELPSPVLGTQDRAEGRNRTAQPPAQAVPLAEVTDTTEVLARVRRASGALSSMRVETEMRVEGMPESVTVSVHGGRDGACVARFTREPAGSFEVLRTPDDAAWVRMDAATLDEAGAPPSFVGKWLPVRADHDTAVALCDMTAAEPLVAVPPASAVETVVPSGDGSSVEFTWRYTDEGVEGVTRARIAADGTDRLLEAETTGDLPLGTMRYLARWSAFDEPVPVTVPDPGSVVDPDAVGPWIGPLPVPGGLLPADQAGPPR